MKRPESPAWRITSRPILGRRRPRRWSPWGLTIAGGSASVKATLLSYDASVRTPLCDLLGIEYPIVQAPMAGTTTPDLVAAVSAAGGLGSFGHAYTDADAVRAGAAAVRPRTDRPFNLTLFVAPVPDEPSRERQRAAIAALWPPLAERALPVPAR